MDDNDRFCALPIPGGRASRSPPPLARPNVLGTRVCVSNQRALPTVARWPRSSAASVLPLSPAFLRRPLECSLCKSFDGHSVFGPAGPERAGIARDLIPSRGPAAPTQPSPNTSLAPKRRQCELRRRFFVAAHHLQAHCAHPPRCDWTEKQRMCPVHRGLFLFVPTTIMEFPPSPTHELFSCSGGVAVPSCPTTRVVRSRPSSVDTPHSGTSTAPVDRGSLCLCVVFSLLC